RQRQSLREFLSVVCPTCQGVGRIRNSLFRYDILSAEVTDQRTTLSAILKEAETLPGDAEEGTAAELDEDTGEEQAPIEERQPEPRGRERGRGRGRFDRERGERPERG